MKEKRTVRTPGVLCNWIACGFAVFTMIAYAVAGRDSYGLRPMVLFLLGIGVILGILLSKRDFLDLGSVIVMACFGAAFGVFINSRFMYYAHQYYGIASDPITVPMILTTIGFVGIILCEIISAFMRWGEKAVEK